MTSAPIPGITPARRLGTGRNLRSRAAPLPRGAPRRVAIVASLAYSLVNFRLDLMREIVAAGHRVTAVAPDDDPWVRRVLEREGILFRTVPMARTGRNPLRDLVTLAALYRLFRSEGFDTVLPYTMKPVIYAGLAGRLAGVPERHAMMTGLGTVYSAHRTGRGHRLLRALSTGLYRLGLAGVDRAFIYNAADALDLERGRMLDAGCRAVRVPGSGVDPRHFASAPLPPGPPRFLMVSRLLEEKGVREFANAARRVRASCPDARFTLLGPFDANPTSITEAEVRGWVHDGTLDYAGTTTDVRPHLAACTVFVLPSAYREGVPRTLLEAMATGRALVTTDRPGCADTVLGAGEDANGILVPPRDADALAEALLQLATDPGRVARMGAQSRALALERFDVRAVNALLLDEMRLVPATGTAAAGHPS